MLRTAGICVVVFFAVCLVTLLSPAVLFIPARAQTVETPTIQWIRQFGSTTDDFASSVALHATGGYVVGATNGALLGQTSVGGTDSFVLKYDANGIFLWVRQFGGERYDTASGVAVDATHDVYVVGDVFGSLPGQASLGDQDSYVRMYGPDGSVEWTRQFGSANYDTASGVAVDATGVYVVGLTVGTFPGQTSLGAQDAFVRKYDANGNVLWTRQFGTPRTDQALGVAADTTGVYVVGYTFGEFPGQTGSGGQDAFVRKYDTNGNELWTRQFGSSLSDSAYGVIRDASDVFGTGIYVGGSTGGVLPGQGSAGGQDAFVRRYDANGNELWTRQFGSAIGDEAYGVAGDATGVYVVGYMFGALPGQTSAGGQDAFVHKYDASGNLLWTSQFGLAGRDWARGVAVDATGAYVVGTLAGGISAGGTDAFVAKITVTTTTVIPAPCTYSITPTSQFFPATSGIEIVDITAQSGCIWSAVSNTNWITIVSVGSGAVAYSVAPNTSAASRAGTLTIAGRSFTVTQAGTAPPSPEVNDGGVVNNASFARSPLPVTPGSIVAVFGSNLNDGYTVLSSSFGPDGRLVTSLGGASVTINNIPAPMFYSTPGQLGVQIPFELAGQTSVTIQVTVGGQTSASRTVFLDVLAPGIFTLSQDGRGAAAVLHQDGVTPVTAQSPARPGEIVVLFATGLGAVTPPLATGAPSAGNRTVAAATVTIDGIPGEVQFSGAAPGFVGLNQINVRIPSSTRSAPNIPVVLSIGGRQSNSVTIAVGP